MKYRNFEFNFFLFFIILFIFCYYLVFFNIYLYEVLCCVDYDEENLSNCTNKEEIRIFSLCSIKDKGKRRLFWLFWERYKDKHGSFKDFDESLDSKIKIRNIMKDDIKNELNSLIIVKNVVSWLLSRRNPSKAKEFKHPKKFTPRFW